MERMRASDDDLDPNSMISIPPLEPARACVDVSMLPLANTEADSREPFAASINRTASLHFLHFVMSVLQRFSYSRCSSDPHANFGPRVQVRR